MALSYRVWTEQEDEMRGIIEKGDYPFIVVSIEQKLTKSGNYEMLALEIEVTDNQGRQRKMKDWIVLMDEMGWKLRHFAATCGLLDKYENRTLRPADFLKRNGVVRIAVGERKDADGNKTGQKQNHVVDYVKPLGEASAPRNDDQPPFIDDDIPHM